MSKTKIDYLDKVWNPMSGCSKISPGCSNCYAERMSKRLAGRFGYPAEDPFRVALHPDKLDEPLRWKKPQVVGVCFMGDLFHEDVPEDFIIQAFNTMANAQWCYGHTFMVLTKRPKRMKGIIEKVRLSIEKQRKPVKNPGGTTTHNIVFSFPLQNIWLGVSAENQEQANARIPVLLSIPAAKRFVSIEPMLGPVELDGIEWPQGDFTNALSLEEWAGAEDSPEVKNSMGGGATLDLVILGGESGPGARPVHPDWVRGVRDQCQTGNVPFFFKQWGAYFPRSQWEDNPSLVLPDDGDCDHDAKTIEVDGEYFHRVGKKAAGRMLDGKEYLEWPR